MTLGMEEEMENLFLKHYTKAVSYEDFIGRCVCARYTRSRLRELLLPNPELTGEERLIPCYVN